MGASTSRHGGGDLKEGTDRDGYRYSVSYSPTSAHQHCHVPWLQGKGLPAHGLLDAKPV